MTNIRFVHGVPPLEAFAQLFATTGWNDTLQLSQEALATSLKGTWFGVCAYEGDALLATGRMLSDGVYQCFICDVIVRPDRQGRGLGREVIRRLLEHARSQGIRWVQLTSARGKRGFYEKLGFAARDDEAPGMDIWL